METIIIMVMNYYPSILGNRNIYSNFADTGELWELLKTGHGPGWAATVINTSH